MLVCFLNCIQFSRLLFEFTFEPSRSIKIELFKARSQTNSTVVYRIFLHTNLTKDGMTCSSWRGVIIILTKISGNPCNIMLVSMT